MKYIITCIICLATLVSNAQNCSAFYPSEVGKTLVYHQLDKRENLDLITSYEVLEHTESGLTVGMTLKDKNGEQITQGSFNAICSDGTTSLDPASIMTTQLQQYEGMEYSVEGDNISVENSYEVGQSIPDVSVTMTVDTGIINITSTVTMTDKKVVRREEITTPAGTFDCYVITYTNTLRMGFSKTMQSTQWIAQGVGMVKEETYKANGRLLTKTVLQTIN